MRTTPDRIRHAISFELIGLLLVIPIGAWVFAMPMQNIGVVSIVAATVATGWNYVYNLLFDLTMQRFTGTTHKPAFVRVIHALLFEAGLLALLVPFIAWYLNIGLWDAFMMDVGFAVFYVVYAFLFNWAYDVVFPIPQAKGRVGHASHS